MGNLLEYLTKFCGWPKCAAVILLSVLIVIPATFSTPIQTVDGIASPLLNKTRRPSWIRDLGENETLPGTLSLCPNVSDAKRFNETQGIRRYLDLRGLRGMNSTSFNVRPDFLMQLFRTFLELKESMSQHLVTLLINNRTVTELQNALTYAWLPSLENANWSATRAEILEIDNGTTYFSSNGSPLMQIRYTLPVSTIYSPANFSKGLPRYPWLYDRNSTNHELTQIVPPSVSDFIQRLQNKSLPVYDGPVFYTTSVLEHVYLAKNSTYGFFDTDQLKADMMEVAQQLRVKEGCGDADMSDLEVNFGLLKPGIVPSRTNGTFFDLTVMPFPFVIGVKQRVFIQFFVDLVVPLANHSDRYYREKHMTKATELDIPGFGLIDQRPLNPAYSFRMHLSDPLNVQWLPRLEALMTSRLNTDIDFKGLVEVRIWDFDPNGWIVKFFVVLRHAQMTFLTTVVDARLPYAASIYSKLDGLELRLSQNSTAYKLMTYSSPEYWQDAIKASILVQCEGEDIKWLSLPAEEQPCPPKKTFTLYVERSSNFRREDTLIKWLPKSEKILDAVQQAFAIANPVTMDNITLTITLMERDDNFQTTTERDASRFSFALSYPKMKSGVYWKLWRYPSYDELNAALQSVADSKVAHTWTVAVPASDDLL